MDDHDIFEDLAQVSATYIIMATDPTKLQKSHHVDFDSYFKYLTDDDRPLTSRETI